MNNVIKRLTDNSIDVKRVKERFLEHWRTVFMLGEVNYLKLYGNFPPISDSSELLAFMMMGAARVFANSITDVPNGAEEYWASVEWMIKDLLPEGTEVSDPVIRISYDTSEDDDE